MKIKEIEKKKEDELRQLLGEKRERLRQLRFSLATGKVKNFREIRLVKKDIAQIMTIINKNKNLGEKDNIKE